MDMEQRSAESIIETTGSFLPQNSMQVPREMVVTLLLLNESDD